MWRSTIGLILTLALSILVAPLAADAQQLGLTIPPILLFQATEVIQ